MTIDSHSRGERFGLESSSRAFGPTSESLTGEANPGGTAAQIRGGEAMCSIGGSVESGVAGQVGVDETLNVEDAGAVLLLEMGGAITRATLLASVAREHRFVAAGVTQSSIGLAVCDIVPGLRRSIINIEHAVHRRLLDLSGPICPERHDGGVSNVVITADDPLRLAVLSLADGPLMAQALRAIEPAAIEVVDCIDPRNLGSAHGSLLERLLDTLGRSPDAILILGPGGDEAEPAGARPAVCLAKALEVHSGPPPAVVFVGQPALGNEPKDEKG